jgi:hypothetical protein
MSLLTRIFAFFQRFLMQADVVETSVTQPTKQKPRDRRRVSRTQYAYILQARTDWAEKNALLPRDERETVPQLVDRLNQQIGLNKSVRWYQRVWSGELTREQCVDDRIPDATQLTLEYGDCHG